MRDPHHRVDGPLEEVGGVQVAVVVDEEVHEELRVAAELTVALQQDLPLGVRRQRSADDNLQRLEHEERIKVANLGLERRAKFLEKREED